MSQDDRPGAKAPQGGGVPGSPTASKALDKVRTALGGNTVPPALPPPADEEDDDDGMLRMSFMEHLEELRSRILQAIIGIAVAAVLSLTFSAKLWDFVSEPGRDALRKLGYPPDFIFTQPMEGFNVVWFKLPLVCAIFLSSPWLLY